MSFKPYSSYKPSGVEWLGNVPEKWEVARVGRFFLERREKVSDAEYPALSVTKNGIVPQLETAAKTDDGDNRKRVCPGDFVINSRSDRKGSSGMSLLSGSVSLISIVMQPQDFNSRFAHHLFRSYPFQEEFYRYGKGIVADLWSTNFSEMRNINIPIPTNAEQATIASFLDRETAKIDTLITKQEKLIALLKEKRQAVISHAIHGTTKYRRVKLGRYVDLLPGYAFPSSEYSHNPDDVPLLRGINVGVGAIRWEETVFWPKDKCAPVEAFGLKEGDLVFGMDRPWISEGTRIAIVTQNDIPSLLLQRVCRLRALSGLRQDFLKLLLTEEAFKQYVEADLTGVSVPHISADQILSYQVNLPSESTQREACDFVFSEFKRIDALTMKASKAISLLAEHRTALISAAVTGKIDVREAISDLQEAA